MPNRPATIVLDEPELGLHPFAIHLLGELLRVAARDGHRVILATQSTDLLGEFDLEEIAVVERRDGSTHVSRPDRGQLDDFLHTHSVAEMWEMNLLGGRPTADNVSAS